MKCQKLKNESRLLNLLWEHLRQCLKSGRLDLWVDVEMTFGAHDYRLARYNMRECSPLVVNFGEWFSSFSSAIPWCTPAGLLPSDGERQGWEWVDRRSPWKPTAASKSLTPARWTSDAHSNDMFDICWPGGSAWVDTKFPSRCHRRTFPQTSQVPTFVDLRGTTTFGLALWASACCRLTCHSTVNVASRAHSRWLVHWMKAVSTTEPFAASASWRCCSNCCCSVSRQAALTFPPSSLARCSPLVPVRVGETFFIKSTLRALRPADVKRKTIISNVGTRGG